MAPVWLLAESAARPGRACTPLPTRGRSRAEPAGRQAATRRRTPPRRCRKAGATRTAAAGLPSAESLLTFADAVALDRADDDRTTAAPLAPPTTWTLIAWQRDGQRARRRGCKLRPGPAQRQPPTTSPLGPASGCPNGTCASSACCPRTAAVHAAGAPSRRPSSRRPRCAPPAAQVRRRLEACAPRRAGSRPRPMAIEIDLDAWVRHQAAGGPRARA
jgi:hypothetical protein